MRPLPSIPFLTALILCAWTSSADAIHLRINAGGDSVDGWESDESFAKGGAHFGFSGKHDTSRAKDTAPNKVYETVRHQDHTLSFPDLPDGLYVVRVHFTDKFDSRERRMDYEIEGVVRIDDFCPFMRAGKQTSRVVIEEVLVRVDDGNGLQIAARKDRGNDVFHAAIEVISADDPSVAERAKSMSMPPRLVNASSKIDTTAEAVKRLTGRPSRLVWTEMERNLTDHVSRTVSGRLLGIDTEDGDGPRVILGKLGSFAKPMLTPDGQQVIYTNAITEQMHVVNFDGSGDRALTRGYASDVWQDPDTGIVWIYARNHIVTAAAKIYRHQLKNPEVRELVYEGAPVGHDQVPWFRVSADGKFAGEAFPWPRCGTLNLAAGPKVAPEIKDQGCWTSVAPDNSYEFMHFLGNHTEVILYPPGEKRRKIKVNTAPPMNGQKVYYPRWGRNDRRFITVSAPQWKPETELYLGRFDEATTRVEEWVQVTHNGRAEYFGDLWVQPEGGVSKTIAPAAPMPAPTKAISASGAEPVWQWENGLASEGVTYQGSTRHSPTFGMDLIDGHAIASDEEADDFSRAVREKNTFTVDALIQSHAADQSGPARIISLSKGGSSRNFTIGQEAGRYVLRLRTTQNGPNGSKHQIDLGGVKSGTYQHLRLAVAGGSVNAWIDGKPTAKAVSLGGDLSSWVTGASLIFGDEVDGGRNWNGEIEQVAFYDEALDGSAFPEPVDREAIRTVVVEARLKEVSRPYGPDETDYPRSLTADLWEVKKVISGELDAKAIIVTRFVMFDRKPVADAVLEPGHEATLVLQRREDRPELDGEHQNDELSVFDAPRYHSVR